MSVAEQIDSIAANRPPEIRLTRAMYCAFLDELQSGAMAVYQSDGSALTLQETPPGSVGMFKGIPIRLVD